MKNIFLFISLTLFLASCTNKKSQKVETIAVDSVTTETGQMDTKTEFLNLFKDIDPQSLHVYPPSWDKNGKLLKSPFEGVIINVNKYPYTDNSAIFLNIKACKKGASHIYAVGKFEIAKNYTGLIVRQKSQDEESLIQLVLWDKHQNKILEGLYLADSFGDEGWSFDRESWITKAKKSNNCKIVTRQKDRNPNIDFTDFTYTDTLKMYELDGKIFKMSLMNIKDTSNYQLKKWK